MLVGTRRALLGGRKLRPFDFDLDTLTFVAGMAKRAGSVFAAAPIVQGKWDGIEGDTLLAVGTTSVFEDFFELFDYAQGTASFWVTPEIDGSETRAYSRYFVGPSGSFAIYIPSGTTNLRVFTPTGGAMVNVDISAWVAGTTYHIVVRWDTKNTLDGTNYGCISINGSHTFGGTTQPTTENIVNGVAIGSTSAGQACSAIIENPKIDRRVWYEATSGTGEPYYFDASGYIDEIAGVYNGGVGMDPALIQASWDCCLDVPTDSAVGAFTSGNGNAWSHPHASALLNNTWLEDTFGPNQQDVVTFNGTNTNINCGSAAALDDLHDAEMTVAFWIKRDTDAVTYPKIVHKTDNASGGTVGWWVRVNNGNAVQMYIPCATTAVDSRSTTTITADGKWHYVVCYFNDAGDRKVYIAVDGKWESSYVKQDAGVGIVGSDVGEDLILGRAVDAWEGPIGHVSIWSDDHHVAGTDFIPPRTKPGAGGALVESWGLDDGTGGTAVATVAPGVTDGTISNGAWTEKWEYTGTPLELQHTTFVQGDNGNINFGSGANIDNLHAGDFTIDIQLRADSAGEANGGRFLSKVSGWSAWIDENRRIRFYSGGWGVSDVDFRGAIGSIPFGRWHNIRITLDAATHTPRCWVNGVEDPSAPVSAGAGAAPDDSAEDLLAANYSTGIDFDGAIGWIRLSDNLRGTANYLPDTRVNPPGNDANAQLLINMDEGAGATATDSSGNGYDGTITSGEWNNTFDQATDSPGSRTYAWGYSIGSDAPSDGVDHHIAVTAGDDWVLRIPVRYEDATAQAQILVYDETGAAAVSTFDGPPLTGLHSGGNGSATLIVANEVFPASLIDGTIHNITDGSSGTITAVGGTNQDTITAALSGGTDDDWDTNDVFMLMPPDNWVWCEPFCVEAPAGSTEMSVQLLNAAGDGVLLWQQAEVQTSLVSNGSLEAGAGNPWIPTDWTNVNLDAGDTVAEAAIVHSGAGSMEWNIGAQGEICFQATTLGIGDFVSVMLWVVSDGTADVKPGWRGGHGVLQANVNTAPPQQLNQSWQLVPLVGRAVGANAQLVLSADTTLAIADRFTDDYAAIELDDVSLTATPASEANSLEGTGIRVDGRDAVTQTEFNGKALNAVLKANRGWIRWRWTPRHSAANLTAFDEAGNNAYVLRLQGAATYIHVWTAGTGGNTLQLGFDDGGGAHSNNWNCAGQIVVGTTYLMEIKYTPSRMELYQDGIVRATITTPIDFGADVVATGYWGSNQTGGRQIDVVYSPV